ncbi:MAG: ORF6N domain-containing protein [Bacteroidetes bacterium]|nr:ORF6N domain-containing protein [Bacteroidota bacterium]
MSLQKIESKIHEIRGQKVMLDFDLAALYEVETKRLKEAVRRNIDSFPDDFMFELTNDELESLRTQFASSKTRGGIRYNPFAFTEQGVAMLSSVLKSKKAVQVHISIMRAFVALRQFALSYKDISLRLKEIEGKFTDVYEALNYLLDKDKMEVEQKKRIRIGYKVEKK